MAACPQRRQFSQRGILFAQAIARRTFALFHYIRRAVGCSEAHKEVDVIRLDGKVQGDCSIIWRARRMRTLAQATRKTRLTHVL
jgi:hypothetical protein